MKVFCQHRVTKTFILTMSQVHIHKYCKNGSSLTLWHVTSVIKIVCVLFYLLSSPETQLVKKENVLLKRIQQYTITNEFRLVESWKTFFLLNAVLFHRFFIRLAPKSFKRKETQSCIKLSFTNKPFTNYLNGKYIKRQCFYWCVTRFYVC